MAPTAEMFKKEDDLDWGSSIFEYPIGEDRAKYRVQLIEKKIDLLENMAAKVSNRRSRRWLNDRLLFELVPRLNVEEIRGLFAPPPWGDDVPASTFSMTNINEWDSFRNIDMDKEVRMIQGLETLNRKRENLAPATAEKVIALNAWRRVDRRTREALRRNFIPDLVHSYEKCILDFIHGSRDEETMVMQIEDPFRRLVLHGVCEFYDLVSVTRAVPGEAERKVTTVRRKRSGSLKIPPGVTMTGFVRAAKLQAAS